MTDIASQDPELAGADDTAPAAMPSSPDPGDPVFAHAGGPLVAVCGLAGGSGTSTLSVLVARAAAARSRAPMLLAELDAASGGLAELVGVTSTRTLGQMAAHQRLDDAPGGLPFATTAEGLRVIASTPRLPVPATDAEITAGLEAASRSHALTVVDCGTVQTPGAHGVLAAATHVVWTVPAGPHVAQRVRNVLVEEGPVPGPSSARELLAVVAARPGGRRGVGRELRDAAAERCERLVFLPFEARIADGTTQEAAGRLASGLSAVLAFLAVPASD